MLTSTQMLVIAQVMRERQHFEIETIEQVLIEAQHRLVECTIARQVGMAIEKLYASEANGQKIRV